MLLLFQNLIFCAGKVTKIAYCWVGQDLNFLICSHIWEALLYPAKLFKCFFSSLYCVVYGHRCFFISRVIHAESIDVLEIFSGKFVLWLVVFLSLSLLVFCCIGVNFSLRLFMFLSQVWNCSRLLEGVVFTLVQNLSLPDRKLVWYHQRFSDIVKILVDDHTTTILWLCWDKVYISFRETSRSTVK